MVNFMNIHLTTENYIIAYWLFSSICASMPPLKENSNFFIVWLHNALQWVAANPYKTFKQNPTKPVELAGEK